VATSVDKLMGTLDRMQGEQLEEMRQRDPFKYELTLLFNAANSFKIADNHEMGLRFLAEYFQLADETSFEEAYKKAGELMRFPEPASRR
jgi:hypothetical protein